MALINCAECGKEISDKADTCPRCESPVNKISKTQKMETTIRSIGKYEATGFLLILIGNGTYLTGNGGIVWVGILMVIIGIAVFLGGRMR